MNPLSDPRGWIEQLAGRTLETARTFLPDLLGALALLLLGWLAAWLLRAVVLRFGKGLDALMATLQRHYGGPVARSRWSVTSLLANAGFWLVIAFSLIGASELLGLDRLADWLSGLVGYLPTLLISAMIFFIGYLISGGLRNLIIELAGGEGLRQGPLLGQLASGLVLAFALLLALGNLGLDVGLLESIILLAAAALLGGAALAFGLGASDSVRNIMASHYLRRMYQPGQRVRIAELRGEILEVTSVGVLLETREGPAFVSARQFLETRPVILAEEEPEDD